MRQVCMGMLFTGLIAATPAEEGGPFGLGIIIGEPTGISAKLWLSRETALDYAAGWSLERRFYLHMDFLWHQYELIVPKKGELPFYIGVGGRLSVKEGNERNDQRKDRIGMRGAIGLDYLFEGIPLDLFAEAALIMDIIPETEIDAGGAVGIRFFF